MGEKVKKIATLIGVAALVVTGIGVFVAPFAGAGLGVAISSSAHLIGLGALASIGIAGLSIGSMPSRPSQEETGSASRGQPYADPSSLGAYVSGSTAVPLEMLRDE